MDIIFKWVHRSLYYFFVREPKLHKWYVRIDFNRYEENVAIFCLFGYEIW